MLKLSLYLDRLRETLWFLPALLVAGSILLSFLTLWVDASFVSDSTAWTFGGDADAARDVLGAIAGSMMTFTAVVFSITIVTLQLASSQFSPRALRTFLRDRLSQLALGTFIATFVYSLAILRAVRGGHDGGGSEQFVPGLSVTFSLALVMCSIGLFIGFINRIAQSIRVAALLQSIGDETRIRIDTLFTRLDDDPVDDLARTPVDTMEDIAQFAAPDAASWSICASRQGVLVALDLDQLSNIAAEHDGAIDFIVGIGDFVPSGAVLARVNNIDRDQSSTIEACGSLKRERTMKQDAAFGMRQIVDIGVRALSPGINDPTTAVQALDQLHDLLRRLARRQLASGIVVDDSGIIRVRYIERTWDAYVELAITEIRRYGADSIQVTRRLAALLRDLLDHVDDTRRDAVRTQLHLLDAQIERTISTEEEREQCRVGDAQGLGGTTA